MNTFKLRRKTDNFIWPSFVDALASLLIVIIFILMIFVIAQYYISQKLSGKDQALFQLQTEIREISNQLTIEKDITKKLSLEILNIQKELDEKDLTLLQKQSSIKNLQNEINMSKYISHRFERVFSYPDSFLKTFKIKCSFSSDNDV